MILRQKGKYLEEIQGPVVRDLVFIFTHFQQNITTGEREIVRVLAL